MSDFKGLYATRAADSRDHNFILATFLRGLYHGDSWFSAMPRHIFMKGYQPIAERLLSETVTVACLPDDPTTIIGYSILSNDFSTIHWVYVKKAWRGHGIARALVPQFPTTISHLTKLGLQLKESKFPNSTFNPFAL